MYFEVHSSVVECLAQKSWPPVPIIFLLHPGTLAINAIVSHQQEDGMDVHVTF